MTIRQRLFISFALILSIIIFIIGIFFYTIFNLNEIHKSQKHRYDQILRVEKLQEYNNSFSWVVLDIITDYDKVDVVKDRLQKADTLFKDLYLLQKQTVENSESAEEEKNLNLILSHFKTIESLIKDELFTLVFTQNDKKYFATFHNNYGVMSNKTENLLIEELSYLNKRLQETESNRDQFIETIKIELVLALLVAFILSFIISSKIIKEIKDMLSKLNMGVLQLFKDDENTIKVNIGQNNELSEITENLNSYLEKQGELISSREELLRNISHELKTPITKGKYLLENLKQGKDSTKLGDINNVFIDIEDLTSKLLEREKLNVATLNKSNFKASTLILESLSKLSIDDESKVVLDIQDDFVIEADKYYMTLVLKNLIDNAMKYAEVFPITIEAKKDEILIYNKAQKLRNDLLYYIQPFTRDPNQQQGHGLGLNIVNKILQMHEFSLNYTYQDDSNIFSIKF